MGRTDAVAFTLEWAAAARALGAAVTYEPGWERRGNGYGSNYQGGLVHHTASPSSATRPNPTLRTLIDGRPDLTGPLCNVTGPWCPPTAPRLHVVAAYPANHAGASGGRSMGPLPRTSLFNPVVFGLEIDYAGLSPMAPGQLVAAEIFGAALCRVLRVGAECIRAHAETSVTGKWDPGYASGKTIDMAAFRRGVANRVDGASDVVTTAEMDAIAQKAADRVWNSYFTVAHGTGKGEKVISGVAMREIYQNTLETNDTLTPGEAGVKFDGDVHKRLTQAAADAHTAAVALTATTGAGGGGPLSDAQLEALAHRVVELLTAVPLHLAADVAGS